MSEEAVVAPPPLAPQWAARLAAVCAGGAVVVLFSWLSGRWRWLALGSDFVPVAPGTAVIVLLLATGLWLRARTPPSSGEPWAITALALAAIALSTTVVIARGLGVELAAERWISGTDEVRAGVAQGRVSFYTATLLGLLGVAVGWRRLSPSKRRVEAGLAFGVTAVVIVILHGYFLGGPLLYGGSTVPVAALTAASILLLAVATTLLAGARAWPLRLLASGPLAGATPPSHASFRTFALLLTGFVLASGFFWYRAERGRSSARTLAAHEAMADATAAELTYWVDKHLATANSIRSLALVWGDLETIVQATQTADQVAIVAQWLRELRTQSDLEFVALFGPDGRVLGMAPDSARSVATAWSSRVRALPRLDRVVVDESELGRVRRLTFWIPLYDPERAQLRLWLALAVDTRHALAPILAESADRHTSEETILWRLDGDTAETINDVTVGGAVPGPLRVGVDSTETLPVARGYLGDTGVVSGDDIRGAPVMAALRPIPGTSWLLVHKINRSELTAPARRVALRATFSSLALALLIAAAVFALWYRRDLGNATRELDHVRERGAALVRLTQLDRMLRLRSATDLAVIRATDESTLLQAVVDAAVQVGGYRMAWVGFAEHDAAHSVRPVAVSGDDRGYLAAFPPTWAEGSPLGDGPTGNAIRTGSIQIVPDIAPGIPDPAWREAIRLRHFASAAAIPIKQRGAVIGSLMLYSSAPHAFHDEEVSLLGDIGDDLSFGLSALRDRTAIASQQEELALFRSVMDHSNDAVFITDVATGRFIDFNETALRLLGYTEEELRALGPRDVVVDMADEVGFKQRAEAVERGDVRTRRSANRRKDGTVFPVEVSLTVMETQGRRLVLSIVRDIRTTVRDEAEKEELQAQVLRAQRMESVGRLAGGVAHDFNNLLTVINATADLAMADLPADSPTRDDLGEIRAAGDRAAALTRQLLAFSRQQVLRSEHLDLNAVVPAFLGMLRRVIGEDIEIEARLASAAAHVFADQGQLEQVLMNLCVNARDAMPGGGRLSLEVDHVVLNAAEAAQIPTMTAGRYVCLSIADTGEGMSADVQARIFEPFFTTKEAGRGTGLGLSTVYGIVKQSGGHIGLTSILGRGTTFRIYLPVAAPPVAIETLAPRHAPSAGTETILIVEDEVAIRAVVRRVLERSGFKVLEAASGEEALKVMAAHTGPLDLVMTDLVMPGMSGIDLAKTVRRERPLMPILLASGYSREAASSTFEAAREWHLISKPYTVAELLAEIRAVLDGTERSSVTARPLA